MASLDIVDFDIILAQAPGGYTARGVTAKLGSTTATMMPWSDPQLLGPISLSTVFAPDTPIPDDASAFAKALQDLQGLLPNATSVNTVGTGLYNALPGTVRDLYNLVWGQVRSDSSKLLRIRLHFDAPELAMLPWEYMKVGDSFLGTQLRQSLIRYPEVADPAGKLGVNGTLKILVWAANPQGSDPLDFRNEVNKIQQALVQGLGTSAQITLIESGGPRDLLTELRKGYHVLHYIGHGKFEDEGMLAFERTPGAAPTWVTADQIEPGLQNNSMLQIVFLNSCETAKGSVTSAYTSLAFNLARFVPAIIAMQYQVADDSAIIFSQEFYQAISQGLPLDVGVTNGRQALIAEYSTRQMDWGVPALFTRAVTATVVPEVGLKSPSENTPPDSTPLPSTSSSTPPVDAALKRDLVDLLTQAFPSRSDLAQLTDFYLGTRLDSIPTDANDTPSVILGIINWCLKKGGSSLAQLIDGAIQMRPARNDLKGMRDRLVAVGLIAGSGQANPTSSGTGGNPTAPPANNPTTPPAPTNTQATPALPQVEPPPVAVFSNGRLSLTPQGRRRLAQTIANATWAATAGGRDGLLANLPQGLKGGVSRSDVAQLHISSIISTSESWGKMTGGQFAGKYALIVLADTGAELSGFGTDGATEEAGVFLALANAMRAQVGQPPAAMPFDN